MTKNFSLKTRLLIFISVPLFLATIITISVALISIWHEIEEVYDAQLVHSSNVLLQLIEHEVIEEGDNEQFRLENKSTELQHKYQKSIAFRVWYENKPITQSNNSLEFNQLQAPPGFSNKIVNGNKWRFFVFIETTNNIRIETSERYSIRYELIQGLILAFLLPILMFIPVAIFIIWSGIQKSLQPVINLSNGVDRRNTNDLAAIAVDSIPNEVAPLVSSINRLLDRIRQSFKREKEFTDHAAHELRTPLAAMKMQTQVLIKKIGEAPNLHEDFENLLSSIDRSNYLLNQLLFLARLESTDFPTKITNLSDCIYEALDTTKYAADEKQHKINVNIPEVFSINAHGDYVFTMIKNILENAIKYTPQGGYISVILSNNGLLEIKDSGPGIDTTHQTKVFERFYRGKNTGQTGSGLGLSIVKWITAALNIDISLEKNTPGGLKVKLDFSKIKVSIFY
ncbi:MAG: two-component system sensor histidine kinase QseC [Cellvibrionaceae bacterium]|jgi:two-component system sensor histidine kinase QseC